jgi:hypothetical protein
MDTSKNTIVVDVLMPGDEVPVIDRIWNEEGSVRHLVGQLGDPVALRACYEAGPTGVGKTTLLELAKYGLGCDGQLAPVVIDHVNDITVHITIDSSRLRITRSIDPGKRTTVRVTDLITGERLPDHRIDAGQPSLNTLLMTALGLPDDMRAAARTGAAAMPAPASRSPTCSRSCTSLNRTSTAISPAARSPTASRNARPCLSCCSASPTSASSTCAPT